MEMVPAMGHRNLAPPYSRMSGTSSDPAYRRIDVDTETGKVSGLF